jgi:nitroreductase
MTPDDCPPIIDEWLPGPEQAEHFLRSRRSIRTYQEKPVDRQALEKLIRIASYAPSGHNRQPVQWHIVYDREELRALTAHVIDWMRYMLENQPDMARSMHMDLVVGGWEFGIDTICRAAPHVIVVHGNKMEPTAQAACTIAMTYLELAAPPLGLGGCWAGFFNAAAMFWPPMQKALSLPDGHDAFGSMMIGYPKYRYHRLPLRNQPVMTWQ